ncbi:MAG: hypothetical protein RIA69_03850 [Cyclobacteriaceae bacterium]
MVNISIDKEGGSNLIKVIGEIDASSSIKLDDALKTTSDAGLPIVMNLEGLN